MIQRKQLESILKINGVSPSSPDEIIRSVLVSAKYNNDEIDTAMMVLRQNTKNNSTRVDGLHKVFRTDGGLKPDEISSLLGIDIEVKQMPENKLKEEREIILVQTATVLIISIVIASVSVLLAMYVYKVGFFHSSVSAFN